jgi:hypothetical protein
MSRITRAIDVEASAATLFHCAVETWEDGLGEFGCSRAPQPPTRGPRMGDGFRVRFSGKRLALPGEFDLEIRDFVEGGGWVAASVSTSGVDINWRWACTPLRRRSSRLACQFDYAPAGISARLIELAVGRRRRARAVSRMLEGLRAQAERGEALMRLKRRRQEV